MPMPMRVYYGPNRSTDGWCEKDAFVWGCCPCADHGDDTGGFAPDLAQVRRAAEDHAKTHCGACAIYSGT